MRRVIQNVQATAVAVLRRLIAGVCVVAMPGSLDALAAEPPRVTIVLSAAAPAYREAAHALAETLGSRAAPHELSATQFAQRPPDRSPVIVTLGAQALRSAVDRGGSGALVAALIPRETFDQVASHARLDRGARRMTAVYLDQPFERQMNLLGLLVPRLKRVGVLASSATQDAVRLARTAAQAHQFSLVAGQVEGAADLSFVLNRILDESDALLALPDATVFNSATVHNILHAALRARRPVIGFSAATVRSGALAAVYSTPAQLGRQSASLVLSALAGAPAREPQYPREFEVGINPVVAQALGLELDEHAVIAARLRALEAGR